MNTRFFVTKFYPVDIDRRVIIDDPHKRERDLAWKYRGRGVIGLLGRRLLAHKCYESYKLERT